MITKPYISWSEFSTYQEDVDKYHDQYILGHKIEQTPKMLYGNLIHKGLEEDKVNLDVEMMKYDFNAKEARIAMELLKARKGEHREVKFYLQPKMLSCGLYTILDGINLKEQEILEYKTTGSAWKSQDEVDSSGQITLYALGAFQVFRVPFKITLIRLDTTNGKIKEYQTTRSPKQMYDICKDINSMVERLKSLNWWEKRLTKNLLYLDEAKENVKKYAMLFNSDLSGDRQQQ